MDAFRSQLKLSFQQRFDCPLLRGSDGVPRDDLHLSRFHALSGPAQTDIQPERNARLAETAFFERTGEFFCRLCQNSILQTAYRDRRHLRQFQCGKLRLCAGQSIRKDY